jgi:thioesterase domain-containing protein
MQLLVRLRSTFGVNLSLQQLFKAPTVKDLAVMVEALLKEEGSPASPAVPRQVERPPRRTSDTPVLPEGVTALQPQGTRDAIFWIHRHLSIGLARLIGNEQPFVSVLLTPEDFSALRTAPTLQNFAARLLRKIQAVQPNGPYTLGGFCLGGLLAYEIGFQLRTAGQEVSFVAIADAPNPSCLELCDTLASRMNYVRYLLKRATRVTPWQSFLYLREALVHRFEESKTAESEMLQAAALAYRPPKFEGKVLLILASEHPPHVDYLPGWQTVVAGDLQTRYVEGHHRDFPNETVLRSVADAIVFHHTSTNQGLIRSTERGEASSVLPVP